MISLKSRIHRPLALAMSLFACGGGSGGQHHRSVNRWNHARSSAMKPRFRFVLPAVVLAMLGLSPCAGLRADHQVGRVNGDGAIGAVDAQAILSAGWSDLPFRAASSRRTGTPTATGLGRSRCPDSVVFVVGLNVSRFCVGKINEPLPVVIDSTTLTLVSDSISQAAGLFISGHRGQIRPRSIQVM